jgi:hypothetical protein
MMNMTIIWKTISLPLAIFCTKIRKLTFIMLYVYDTIPRRDCQEYSQPLPWRCDLCVLYLFGKKGHRRGSWKSVWLLLRLDSLLEVCLHLGKWWRTSQNTSSRSWKRCNKKRNWFGVFKITRVYLPLYYRDLHDIKLLSTKFKRAYPLE